MSIFSKLIKTAIDTVQLPIAVIKDIATLGGVVNDGHYSNGNRTYTGKKLNDIGNDVEEIKDEC